MATMYLISIFFLFFSCWFCCIEAAPISAQVCFSYLPIQAASAAISYVGLVAALDRPKGSMAGDSGSLVRVGPSKVAGIGLFCNVPKITKGTVLGTYPGTLIPLQQNLGKVRKCPGCVSYIWRFTDSKMIIDPTNEFGDIEDYTYGGSAATPGSMWICQNLLSFLRKPTFLCRINEPPKGFDVNVRTEEDLTERTITFTLERDVYDGEEFFIDYGLSYDRSSYGPNPGMEN
mmetsp:Transcript_5417/g.7837  ORF Transcript_5417/g.7837 Transcript_5417/m.7837 type:complete len:231 (+) Transcript_5417:75-767(+)